MWDSPAASSASRVEPRCRPGRCRCCGSTRCCSGRSRRRPVRQRVRRREELVAAVGGAAVLAGSGAGCADRELGVADRQVGGVEHRGERGEHRAEVVALTRTGGSGTGGVDRVLVQDVAAHRHQQGAQRGFQAVGHHGGHGGGGVRRADRCPRRRRDHAGRRVDRLARDGRRAAGGTAAAIVPAGPGGGSPHATSRAVAPVAAINRANAPHAHRRMVGGRVTRRAGEPRRGAGGRRRVRAHARDEVSRVRPRGG